MAYIYEDKEAEKNKRELKKSLENMQNDIAKGEIIGDEIDKIWQKIANDAASLVPIDTGTLMRSIRVVDGAITGGASDKSITLFDRSIIAGDEKAINPKTKSPCNYAVYVHDGYVDKSGNVHIGIPFLTMAMALNEAELQAAVNRALAKIGQNFSEGSKN